MRTKRGMSKAQFSQFLRNYRLTPDRAREEIARMSPADAYPPQKLREYINSEIKAEKALAGGQKSGLQARYQALIEEGYSELLALYTIQADIDNMIPALRAQRPDLDYLPNGYFGQWAAVILNNQGA